MGRNDTIEGRWVTPDPLGGDITNPQCLNRYAYALNNPTTLTDPQGLDPSNCTSQVDANGEPYVSCTGPDTVTVNGGSPSSVYAQTYIDMSYSEWSCLINNCILYGGQPTGSGGGGGAPSPAPKPAPTPDVPLNPFASAVFARVGCETQFLDQLPSVSGGGVFGFAGENFSVPGLPTEAEFLGIANYDTGGGLSTGLVAGVSGTGSGPIRFLGAGIESAYNWQSGTVTSEGLGFFGSETEGLSVGAVGGGLFFGSKGAVGVFGEVGPFGGGGYLNLSYPGCGGGS